MLKQSTLVCVALGALLSTARADTEPTAQLTLPKGRVLLDAFLEINLSDGRAGKPISLSPDVWYGATDDLTVGLVHSGLGTTGFIGGFGFGFRGDALCLTGDDNGCDGVYTGAGLEVRYRLKPREFAWAVNGGLYALDFDPLQLAVKLGVVGRWEQGKLAVEFAPNVFLGVTNRDVTMDVLRPNGETLFVPATAFYTVAPKIAVALQLGLVLPFEHIGDTYQVPVSISGHYELDDSVGLNLAFSLPRLVAGSAPDGIDVRSITLGGTYAF
jgi:hypothetical protein